MQELVLPTTEQGIQMATGVALLHDPLLNKGTAFSLAERRALGLQGLLPPAVETLEEQAGREIENIRRLSKDINKYTRLMGLHDTNETLFYRVVRDNLEEILPIIYTPTVGTACQEFGRMFRRPRGLYIPITDRGHVAQTLRNWPHRDVRVIVVTDGERILGLGDLGASGMGIPVGKLSLYTACSGIHPAQVLPVTLDVGTDNEAFLADPHYLGLRTHRTRGEEYDAFVEEFVMAVQENLPLALIQFEDFGNANAFRLLEKYRNRVCTFNDDIQGTAATATSGMISSLRLVGGSLRDQKVLFYGAGEAAIGIASLIVSAMVSEGASLEEARQHCWLMDRNGLIVKGRDRLTEHKAPFAHDHEPITDLQTAIQELKPTALIGACAIRGAFTEPIVREMARINERPIVMALSNPTSKAECTAEQAYKWSDGRAVYTSGSPFPPVDFGGKVYVPGQGNNAYIFPGLGLGIVASQARRVTDKMFFTAAKALASLVQESDLALGRVYPPVSKIWEISATVAEGVAEVAFQDGLARIDRPDDLKALIRSMMWDPQYQDYLSAR